MNEIASIFTEQGGLFCIPVEDFVKKLNHIKAFIFDWDGVFNDGIKNEHGSSSFSEVDAMGTNLLRFSSFIAKKKMPVSAVMSGEKNVFSFQYGKREHFHAVYYRVKNKRQAFDHFIEEHDLKPHEIAFVFDDVLDLSLSEVCGIRILVNRQANPLFKKYVIDNRLADYITAQPGGSGALREGCELLIGLLGHYETIIKHRLRFSSDYSAYYNERQLIPTSFFTWKNNYIEKVEEPA